MNYNEDFTFIHDSINGAIAFILNSTIYTPNNGDHINMVYDVNSLSLFHLVQLGLVERKTLNEKYILSDKGFEFLLWTKENYFEEIIHTFDTEIHCDFENYIDLLIKKEDLALVLSITRNPDKWKFLGDSL